MFAQNFVEMMKNIFLRDGTELNATTAEKKFDAFKTNVGSGNRLRKQHDFLSC